MPIYTSKFNKIQHQKYNINDLFPLFKFTDISLIFQKMPKNIHNYHEMFTGNGAIMFKLIQSLELTRTVIENEIRIHDLDWDIINLYNVIKSHPNQLKSEVRKLFNEFEQLEKFSDVVLEIDKIKNKSDLKFQEEYYYFIQNLFNIKYNSKNINIERASYLIFLSKLSKGNVYCKIHDDLFLVPYGNSNSFYSESQIDSLSYYFNKYNISFFCESIKDFSNRVNNNDFIFINSPYIPATLRFEKYKIYSNLVYNSSNDKWETTKTSKLCVKYMTDIETNDIIPVSKSKTTYRNFKKQSNFDIMEHKQILKICNKLNNINAKFMLFNSNCEWIRELYSQYTQTTILLRPFKGIKPNITDYDVLVSN